MKTRSLFLVTFAIAFALLSTERLSAEPVLTEDVMSRYMAIYPLYMRITFQLDATSKMANGEAKDKKVEELILERNQLLTGNGWEDFVEFMDVDVRVMRGITPMNILLKFENAPESDKKQVEDAVTEKLKDYTPKEIALLKKKLRTITKMREAALAGK
ncbi:MAG: hypothetical protein K8S54_17495 [Spirochaetia bacterium]|nr:hypothetical protein [Spirochaetia bacterium]